MESEAQDFFRQNCAELNFVPPIDSVYSSHHTMNHRAELLLRREAWAAEHRRPTKAGMSNCSALWFFGTRQGRRVAVEYQDIGNRRFSGGVVFRRLDKPKATWFCCLKA